MASLREVLQIGAGALGVDIGKSAIKAVELRRTARGVEMIRFGVAPTPARAVEGGMILDRTAVAQAVAALLRESGIRRRRATVAVAGVNVLARVLRLPPIPEQEVKQAIRWEAERLLPIPVEEAVLDVLTVGEVAEDGQRQIEVLLAAVPERLVLTHIETLGQARIFVEAIDVGAVAMTRALLGSSPTGTQVLINLGASTTDVAVVRHGVPQFTRTIPSGGDAITEALAAQLGIDAAEAEQIKIRHGMAFGESTESGATYAGEMLAAAQELVTQLRRSLDFYRVQFPGGAPDAAVLCGGGARMRDLDSYLAGELELPVTIGTPYVDVYPAEAIEAAGREVAPQLVVAAGLALRAIL